MGKATEKQFVEKFGKPKDRFQAQDGTTSLYYENIAPVAGRVEVLFDRKSRLINIELSPTKSSLQEILQVYGPGYRIAHFDFDCGGDGENIPIYEAKNGRYRHFLYESIGVSVSEEPLLIDYTTEPIGPKKSKCGKK